MSANLRIKSLFRIGVVLVAVLASTSVMAQTTMVASFSTDRTRVAPGWPIVFHDLSTGHDATKNQWVFINQSTTTETTASGAEDVTKTFTERGKYTVRLTVSDASGSVTTEIRDVFEVMNPPFVDFIASPKTGPAPLAVRFTNTSNLAGAGSVSGYTWNFGVTADPTPPQRNQENPVYTYSNSGAYTVSLRVDFSNNTSLTRSVARMVIVGGSADEATAQIEIVDMVKDTQALLPLSDWQPLFGLRMSTDPENPALRYLSEMDYTIIDDPVDGRPYDVINLVRETDVLEFGLFVGGIAPGEDAPNDLLDKYDSLIATWQAGGSPYDTTSGGDKRYKMDMLALQAAVNRFVGPAAPSSIYMIAFRTSPRWRSATSISFAVSSVTMLAADGTVPRDDEGKPIDTYPDPTAWPIISGGAYSSSFGVYDVTGSYFGKRTWDQVNTWFQPTRVYTPLGEHYRPRWDIPGKLFEFTAGEFVEMRHLTSLENWTAVLGINVHSAAGPQVASGTDNIRGDFEAAQASMLEVNVVLTDIGADPYGPEGNGGFNPKTMLEHMTRRGVNPVNLPSGVDFTFNGISVFQDTNNNGTFEAPTQSINGAVIDNDWPMWPYSGTNIIIAKDQNGGPTQGHTKDATQPDAKAGVSDFDDDWEWVPFPPGGGDPWWKIKLRLRGYRRLPLGDTNYGTIEATPDAGGGASFFNWGTAPKTSFKCDYFVTIRPDSGYLDSSYYPGDGTGMAPGADFKAFIAPRHTYTYKDPSIGLDKTQEDGGIFVDSQIPDFSYSPFGVAWQDDDRWGDLEPWWPQRTHNEDTVKALRTGVEVHDLVLTYNSNNLTAQVSDIGQSDMDDVYALFGLGFNFADDLIFNITPTTLDRWMDPAGFRMRNRFYDRHSPGTMKGIFGWYFYHQDTGQQFAHSDDQLTNFQFPYETVPFATPDDLAGHFRSPFYVFFQPTPSLPDYDTWPGVLPVGQYPRATDWPSQKRAARYLKQRIDIQSRPTALLGFNLTGSSDAVTNRYSQQFLDQITVAFWGPNFTPDDLAALDLNGSTVTSGITLVEDGDGDGVYWGDLGQERLVPLSNLHWPDSPEFVDMDGDGFADDLSGDGSVTTLDRAWVVRLDLKTKWRLPDVDDVSRYGDFGGGTAKSQGTVAPGAKAVSGDVAEPSSSSSQALFAKPPIPTPGAVAKVLPKARASSNATMLVDMDRVEAEAAPNLAKADAPAKAVSSAGNEGDDLFLVVSTSKNLTRFEQFKAFVPATLPSRTSPDEKLAGFRFSPQVYVQPDAYKKAHVEEGPVQGFFEHEMLEANVPCEIINLTGPSQKIERSSGPVALLGIDLSTNRGAAGLAASGSFGLGGTAQFTVTGAGWGANAYAGYWLVDGAYKSFEILSNTNERLTLRGGTPTDGRWQIVIDPTFLEQVIVELYGVENGGLFDQNDLQPLNKDQSLSGVAIYRDNRFNPANRQGQFDPAIDIPIELDDAPVYIGNVGETRKQVKFVFSSPGTDDLPPGEKLQLRQWIPDSFGSASGDADSGPEFFVVVRTSSRIDYGDEFRAAIVSWGPNTPTEPDPDQFTNPPPPVQPPDEFDIFSEFPWGERAIGLITMFKNAPDNSGFKWIRTTVAQAKQTNIITAEEQIPEPGQLVLSSTSTDKVPTLVPAGGFSLAVYGSGFGAAPTVTLAGVTLNVMTASDTAISALAPEGSTFPTGPLNLTVRNTTTGASVTRTDLVRGVDQVYASGPKITNIAPARGGSGDFPIDIYGTNFDSPQVFFDQTTMPIVSWTPTKITVGFPLSGLPTTGVMDVTVNNSVTKQSDVAVEAFYFVNGPSSAPQCFIATAAYGTPFAEHLASFRAFRDQVLLKSALGTALVEVYYSTSPMVADYVGAHPWAAYTVRGLLTPVAWAIEVPWLLLGPTLLIGVRVVRRGFLKRVRDSVRFAA